MELQKPTLKNDPNGNSTTSNPIVAVAGHICLDIIPSFQVQKRISGDLLVPGKLVIVGPALMAAGGAVSNTGLALHRLGVPTVLMGKIGCDSFGNIVLDLLNTHDSALTKGMIMAEASNTSYTIVISPPGCDRMFFHSPGANDYFSAADIDDTNLEGIRLFHFGYPPLMRLMYQDEGKELEKLFRRVHKQGITTSLDMAKPDPASEAGDVDWIPVLEKVLPFVDIFQPSLDEILYMIDGDMFHFLTEKHGEFDFIKFINTELLDRLADALVAMGSSVVAIKLGDQGLYLRTGPHVRQLAGAAGPAIDLAQWSNRQLLAPCFETNVVGTTGTGDCTIAGFLTSLLAGEGPINALRMAVGVGACSTEKLDATSGVPSRHIVHNRIVAGWQRKKVQIEKRGWKWLIDNSVWQGPRDRL